MKYNFKTFMINESEMLDEVFEPKMPDIDLTEIERDDEDGFPNKVTFLTDKENEVDLDMTYYPGPNSIGVSFMVNGTYEDKGSERDADVLSGVLALVEKAAEDYGVNTITFDGFVDSSDKKFKDKRNQMLADPKRVANFESEISEVLDEVRQRIAEAELRRRADTVLTLEYWDDEIRDYNHVNASANALMGDIEKILDSDVPFLKKRSLLDRIEKKIGGLYGEGGDKDLYDVMHPLRYIISDFVEGAEISTADLGIRGNRRSNVYERLVTRFFGDKWDVDRNGSYIKVTRKNPIKRDEDDDVWN